MGKTIKITEHKSGIVGFGVFFSLLVLALSKGKPVLNNPHLMGVVGYLAILMTYNRGLNIHAASIIFLFSLWQNLLRPPHPHGNGTT